MRPVGEISTAILNSAASLVREEQGQRRGPTLKELLQQACVGYDAGLNTVKNLTRAGKLEVVAERRVDYRNKPVAEYAPADPDRDEGEKSFWDVASVVTVWARG